MESKYSFENEAVAAALLPNKNDIDFAKDAVVEAEKIRYKNPQEARRLLLHAAEIYLETAKNLTDPTLCTSLLYLAHSYSFAASHLSLKTAVSQPSTEYLSYKNTASETNSYQGRISITNNIINKPKNKPKSAPLPITKTPIEDMLELEDRLAALSMSFSMATSKSYINTGGIGSQMNGSITSDCQSKIESYLYLSDYVTAYPNKNTKNVGSSMCHSEETKSTIALPHNTTTSSTTSNSQTTCAPTIPPSPCHSFVPNTPQCRSLVKSELVNTGNDYHPTPDTTSKTVAPAAIVTTATTTTGGALCTNNQSVTIQSTHNVCTGNELRLLQSIQRLGDENLVLIQRLESLSNLEETLKKLQKEMQDLIFEYKKRFKKIRNILQTANSSDSGGDSRGNASAVRDPQDKMRIGQLEGVMFQLMKRLEQAKIDSDAKDEMIRNLKQKNRSMKNLLAAAPATTGASPAANNSQSSHGTSTTASAASSKSSTGSSSPSSSSSKPTSTPPPPPAANSASSVPSSSSGGTSRQSRHASKASRSLDTGTTATAAATNPTLTSGSSVAPPAATGPSHSHSTSVNYGYHHSSTATLQTSLHRSRTSTATSTAATSLKVNTATSKA